MASHDPGRTVGEALTDRRLRLIATWWPWRCAGYLLCSPVVAFGWLLTCLPLGPWAGVPLGVVERWRVGWVTPGSLPSPHRRPPRPGPAGWLACRLRETATWHELLYGVLLVPLSVADALLAFMLLAVPGSLVAAPLTDDPHAGDRAQVPVLLGLDTSRPVDAVLASILGFALLVPALYAITALALGRTFVAGSLLAGDREAQLGQRIRELVASRTRVVLGIEAERRRIERDLHDGAQQRLTSLLMTLGLLRLRVDDDVTRGLVDKARDEASQALRELRDLVHGIYPATLRERGLAAVLAEIADSSPLPVELRVDLPGRPPAGIEFTVYCAVCEALANVGKHSSATSVTVSVGHTGDRLVATVTDDGVGGADPAGSGLVGIVDRVEAYGGTVTISSPPGGPTIIAMEAPCEW